MRGKNILKGVSVVSVAAIFLLPTISSINEEMQNQNEFVSQIFPETRQEALNDEKKGAHQH